jgi:Domain of Unknown Function with PDB structure (DUF3857)
MRIPVLARYLLLLLAIASPVLLRAQFQKPTDEELKMTGDPKAPGAAAVYLYLEESTDDPRQFHGFYARIKVLQDAGKELATISIPYESDDEKVVDFQGRTIHSDGTVIPLRGKPQDQLGPVTTTRKGVKRQINRKVFTLPGVEVGCILEYRYTLRYEGHLDQFSNILGRYTAPQWVIQRPYFVHKARFVFMPMKEFLPRIQTQPVVEVGEDRLSTHNLQLNVLKWDLNLPEGVKLIFDSNYRYIVDVTDVPPTPDLNSGLYFVFFHYENVVSDHTK